MIALWILLGFVAGLAAALGLLMYAGRNFKPFR